MNLLKVKVIRCEKKINKSSCYLQKYHTYRIPPSQGDSVYHPVIAVFSRILQISPKKSGDHWLL